MNGMLRDVTYSVRALKKSPGFTTLAVLALALGIGANTTIFSWINSTLLNPLPAVKNTGQLLTLDRGTSTSDPMPFSYPDYLDLRDQQKSFSGLIAFDIDQMNLTGIGKPEHIWGSLVSENYFDALEVHPILGRGFLRTEGEKPGGSPVVVISYRLWQTHFAADRDIVGRKININRDPYEVVGVAPPLFQGTQTGLRAELWIPMVMRGQILPGDNVLQNRENAICILMGRLKPGSAPMQAQQEMNLLFKQIAERYPESHKAHTQVTAYPLWRAPYGANAYFYVLFPTLLAIAGFVLLLACANVANLLLVRSVARRREVAIRLSMGAGRWRLVRQFLAESLVLALLGGGVALLITVWTSGALTRFIPPAGIPISMEVHPDATVLLVTFLISIATGVIFGTLPAVRSSALSPAAVLKEETGTAAGGQRKARLSSALVVMQISLSLLLLVCAGLFIRSFRNAERANPGFNPRNVLLASVNLYAGGYKEADGLQFVRQLTARVQAVPGVESVSVADWVPLGFAQSSITTRMEGYNPQPHESMEIRDAIVGPGYFRTMEIPLAEGREFTDGDTDKSMPVVVVNQALANRYWPHEDAIAKHITIDNKKYLVVGVARNSSYTDLDEDTTPFLYLPEYQDYFGGLIIHARVEGEPLALSGAVEKAVHDINPELPVFDIATLQSRTDVASTGERIAGAFVGAFGIVALVLAAVGIYGVIAYTTRQRTHELGVRMALGAQRRNILTLVLRQGLRLTAAGMTIGLVISLAMTRFLQSMLFNVPTTDVVTFASVVALLSMVALAACYVPARRAAAIDPMAALRHE